MSGRGGEAMNTVLMSLVMGDNKNRASNNSNDNNNNNNNDSDSHESSTVVAVIIKAIINLTGIVRP